MTTIPRKPHSIPSILLQLQVGRTSLHTLRKASQHMLVGLVVLLGVLCVAREGRAAEPPAPTPTPTEAPIIQAVASVNAPLVEKIVQEDPAQANAVDRSGNTALYSAIASNSTAIITLLLDAKADANKVDREGRPPLVMALDYGNRDAIRALLDHGADPNTADRQGRPPLIRAVSSNNKESTELLLQKGAKADSADRGGVTALNMAIQNNSVVLVTLLLDNKASVKSRDPEGVTPLVAAAMRGNLDITRLLLQKGAEVNAATNRGDTALHLAAQNLNPLVDVLIKAGADPSLRNARGDLPLHLALRRLNPTNRSQAPLNATYYPYNGSYSGEFGDRIRSISDRDQPVPTESPEASLALLIEKSDINARDRLGFSPLLLAILAREPEVRDLISERHPRADATTQLFNAVAGGDTTTVEKLLTQKPFLVYFRLPDGTTPLHVAALWGTRGAAEALLKRGADANSHDASGATPLHECASRATGLYAKRARAMTKLLVDHGCDPNARDTQDSTPLLYALTTGDRDLIAELLTAKANPNARDVSGQAPLHLLGGLSKGTDAEVATLLLGAGADVNVRDREGNTPLMRAVSKRRPELVKALLEKGASVNDLDANGQPVLSKVGDSFYGDNPDQVAVIEALLKKGADPNSGGPYNQTVLSLAANGNNKDLVAMLLDYKANPNASDVNGYGLPLAAAINHANKDMVSLLLEHGADPTLRSGGTTMLEAAQRNGNKEIIALIQAKVDALNAKK